MLTCVRRALLLLANVRTVLPCSRSALLEPRRQLRESREQISATWPTRLHAGGRPYDLEAR